MNRILIAVGLAASLGALPAYAQHHDDIDNEVGRGIAPTIERDPAVGLKLPADVPLVPGADAMTPFLVPDLSDRQTFSFDPNSFRVTGKIVMLTVTATSKTGAKTSGYYAFNCDKREYRLLGFPSGGQWKASSRTKWRPVRGIKSRPSQFPPLYEASCATDGTVVRNVADLQYRLLQDNPNTD